MIDFLKEGEVIKFSERSFFLIAPLWNQSTSSGFVPRSD